MTPVFRASLLRLLLLSTLAAAPALADFTEGKWLGKAYKSDDGKLASCGIHGAYKSGVILNIHLTRDRYWATYLLTEKWKAKKGARIDVTLEIDDFDPILGHIEVTKKTEFMLRLPSNKAAVTLLQRGKVLKLTSPLGNEMFDLTGSHKAIERLRYCVASHLMTEQHLTPSTSFGGLEKSAVKTDPTKVRGYTFVSRANATVFVTNLLAAAGITGFRILDEDLGPGFENSVIWEFPDGSTGFFAAVKNQSDKPLDAAVSREISIDSGKCDHSFVSGKKPPFNGDNVSAQRMFSACERSDGTRHVVHYTYVKTLDGTIARFIQRITRAPDYAPNETDDDSDIAFIEKADWTQLN